MIHHEPKETSLVERARLLRDVQRLVATRREAAGRERAAWFSPDTSTPDAYERSLATFRHHVVDTLGWPLAGSGGSVTARPPTAVRCELAAEDEHGRIYRVHVPSVGPMHAYGLLFLPAAAPGEDRKYPLVIAQHGGHGTPELASGFWPEAPSNYHGMIAGLRARAAAGGTPVAIFAPQLLVWDVGQQPQFDQLQLDRQLRHLGGSRAALDLRMLRDSLDWLVTHPEIDSARIGMTGLSYGGFYSLYFAALEPRIRVVVSSCYANDCYRHDSDDRLWTDSARHFLTGEIARMVCPRPLFLEAGENDTLFTVAGFPPVAAEVASAYAALGLEDRFESRVHPGGHEYSPDGKAGEFLLKWL